MRATDLRQIAYGVLAVVGTWSRASWLYVVFGVVLAFAFTFPLFLLLRERAVLATGSSRLTTRRNLPAP